jgi:hypothetical protein
MIMEQMVRHAADNKYLHRDFHGIMNLGISYLQEQFGDESVIEYLQEYTRVFHKPLIDKTKAQGLIALEEYFKNIYEIEEVLQDVSFEKSEGELIVKSVKCPAVTHIRKSGLEPAKMLIETTRTIGQTLADESGYAYELKSYDEQTGASVQRFFSKEAK